MNLSLLRRLCIACLALLTLNLCPPGRADTTYLGLKQAVNVKTGWGTPGDNRTINGHELSIGQTMFERGFTLHAPGEATFNLDGNQKWLAFYTGIAGDMTENSSAILTVEVDGKQAYQSPLLQVKQDPAYVVLPINGAHAIHFIIGDGGNGNAADHLVIANLRATNDTMQPTPDVPVLAPIVPVTNTAPLMPRHGTVSITPAKKWDDGLAAGNGNMGALLDGDPRRDTLLVDHCKLWLPAGSREVLPNAGAALPEMRRVIGEQGYDAGQKFFLQKAREGGWGGSLVWTDAFHPGFFLSIAQPQDGPITNYARVENFATGEVWAQWHSDAGDFARRMFVSKPDNTIVSTTTGPRGKVSLKLSMEKLGNNLIDSSIVHANGWITCHNVYIKGKGGYDGAVRVINDGGTQTSDGTSVSVNGANSVTLLIRILPYRTPLAGSQAWPNDPANPDFAGGLHVARRDTVQITGKAYDSRWMNQLKADLRAMPPSYAALLKPHAAAWGALFNRVSIDLGGLPAERAMSSEALLDVAQKEKRLPVALLERMYDAGRYVFLCSAGPQTPPNLFGIWTGTWQPAWSGDYTTDTNLQLDTELAYSANLAECMNGYFHLWNSFLPDFRRNAKALYGTRGILTGSRASNNGLALHWDGGWPGNQWTPGAAWIAHWYYDYYQYTGDRKFLREQAIPWMKECALFYEDFLKGTEDASGHYVFRPSFSAENGYGDNASQDIEITHELLTNLIAGCETLGIEKEGVTRWKAMLAKLPPLLINDQGQLKEWSNPAQGEKNNHRHLMHLYGAFESLEFSEEADPKLFAAARVALVNRVQASTEDATHGFMHTGLAAVGLGLGDLAFARIEELAKRRSIYPSMVDGHFGGPSTLCDDGNGATPEIVNRMFVQSKIGRLTLLPAVPRQLPKGALNGTRARGSIGIDRLAWDMSAGRCQAVLTSQAAQTLDLALGRDLKVTSISANGKPLSEVALGVHKWGARLSLPSGKPVIVVVNFTREAPDPNTPVAVENYTLPVRLACVGDSITAGVGVADGSRDAYPAQLQRMLGDKWTVGNFGNSGSTLLKQGDKPYQSQRSLQDALGFNPDVVVIMLGTNDSKPQNWAKKDQFSADYKDLIEKFKALPTHPRIFICHPPLVPGAGNYGINEPGVLEEIPLIDAVAKEESAGVIDVHGAFAGQDALFPDRVHPNTAGATVLAKTIFKALTGRELAGNTQNAVVEPINAAPRQWGDWPQWGDQSDGTYNNPVLPADYSDLDCIRVSSDYYAMSSTFQFSPGVVILHSKDLVNWTIAGHAVSDITQIGPEMNWDRMNRYGNGIWAGALRYHEGKFWAYFGTPDEGYFMTTATDVAGPWTPLHPVLAESGWDDCCPFWDDDGQGYLIGTNFKKGYTTSIFKLTPDNRNIIKDSGVVVNQGSGREANKLYKINGWYYHFYSEDRGGEGRVVMMQRAKSVLGPYTEKKQLTHGNREAHEPNQGGIVDTEKGGWQFFTHHGTGAWEGRAASLLPVTWIDGWPIIGVVTPDGIGDMTWSGQKPVAGTPIVTPQSDDEFNGATLGPQWEWNYQPRAEKWSLAEKPGFLRLHAFKPLQGDNLLKAGNTLTQRSFRTSSNEVVVKLDLSGMADGQKAGLCHFVSNHHSVLGVAQEGTTRTLEYKNDGKIISGPVLTGNVLWVRSMWGLDGKSQYAYSVDDKTFTDFGEPYQLQWGGYRGDRIGLYSYNNKAGEGFVDVDFFHYTYNGLKGPSATR